MIIRPTSRGFVMVRQHDHAFFAGEIARHFRLAFFGSGDFYEETMQAIDQHDRSWIALDDVPLWDDRHTAPRSFMEYPVLPKIAFYKMGLDEIEAMNPYGGLLCSLHYTSFFGPHLRPEEEAFLAYERNRQATLKSALGLSNPDLIHLHFQLLQLCDNISLYVCLNEAGIDKAEEHPWYQQGFPRSTSFNHEGQQRLTAVWKDTVHLRIHPFPFDQPFRASLKWKEVAHQDMETSGMREAYEQAAWQEQEVVFCQK